MDTKIVEITGNNNHVYENLCQLYEAEFAPLTGEIPDCKGLFTLQTPVIGYSNTKNAWGYLLYNGATPIGFAILNKVDNYFDVAEFYIIPSHRKKNAERY